MKQPPEILEQPRCCSLAHVAQIAYLFKDENGAHVNMCSFG
jgi:hypothetical protein